METSTIIIGLVILIAFITPFVFVNVGNSKRKKAVQDLCENNDFNISEQEEFASKLLALDRKLKALLFVDHSRKRKMADVVRLSDVANCSVLGCDPKSGEFKPIGLALEMKTDSVAKQFVFADSTDGVHNMEIAYQLAQDWNGKIAHLMRLG